MYKTNKKKNPEIIIDATTYIRLMQMFPACLTKNFINRDSAKYF